MFIAQRRYLELNGDDIAPDRHSDVRQRLKSHFQSVAFSTILITQGLNLALNDNPRDGLIALPAQVITCLMLRDRKKDTLNKRFSNNNGKVFDTDPPKPNPTTSDDLKAANITKKNEVYSCLPGPALIYSYVIMSSYSPMFSLSFTTAFLGFLPIITETLASTYRMHQVTKGKWAIIDRDQMKKVEKQEFVNGNLKPSPGLSPV
jgi:hypothetical protein